MVVETVVVPFHDNLRVFSVSPKTLRRKQTLTAVPSIRPGAGTCLQRTQRSQSHWKDRNGRSCLNFLYSQSDILENTHTFDGHLLSSIHRQCNLLCPLHKYNWCQSALNRQWKCREVRWWWQCKEGWISTTTCVARVFLMDACVAGCKVDA